MCRLSQTQYVKEGGHISNLQGSLKKDHILFTVLGRSFLDLKWFDPIRQNLVFF